MNPALRDELVRMERHDLAVRAELAAQGSLFDGYHPRMEAVHRAHAARLEQIIAEIGWPTERLVGQDGAHAAWLIAQHSIGQPDFMRRCRDLLDRVSRKAEIPRWHFAYIDDRIRVYEGSPQRFGTQFRDGPEGPEPYPIDAPEQVDDRRAALGLPPLAQVLARQHNESPPRPTDFHEFDARETAWRRAVGWIR